MQPAVPERPDQDGPWVSADDAGPFVGDVGSFDQGNEFTRWALARYIVGRVILERVSWALLGFALVFLVLGGLCEWGLHSTFLAVLCVLVALAILAMRAILRAVLHRLMAAAAYGPLEDRVRAITSGAGAAVLAEMRRVGLPGHMFTLPLLAPRLVGRRRHETMAKIRQFDVERAVPKARRDELHMVLREAVGRPGGRR
jgi:hypothetical protein